MNTESTGPVSLYSTWWIKPGQEEELVPALRTLASDILEHEQGTLMYLVHYPRYDFPGISDCGIPIASEPKVRPGTVVFIEKYKDWEAFKMHLCGPIFTKFTEKYKSKFVLSEEGFPFTQVVFMKEVAGFSNK